MGTSAGSIIAAFAALGVNAKDAAREAEQQDLATVTLKGRLSKQHLKIINFTGIFRRMLLLYTRMLLLSCFRICSDAIRSPAEQPLSGSQVLQQSR
jgi:predicted acylesterase/phospholipase RssA